MQRLIPTLLAAWATAAPAQPFIDNPGFCDAPAGEQELADVTVLDATGVGNHYVSCAWDIAPQRFPAGRPDRIGASCDTGAEQWQTMFKINVNVNDTGRVTAYWDAQTPPETLPETYFSCDLWGFKAGQ